MRIYRLSRSKVALAILCAISTSQVTEAQRRGRTARSPRVSRPVAAAPAPVQRPARAEALNTTPFEGSQPFTTGLFATPPDGNRRSTSRIPRITSSEFSAAPKALETLSLPSLDVSAYVADEAAAIALGKALFWDQQMGSDGVVACATCHSSFGVDARTQNTVAPGGFASAQSPDFDDDAFYGPNKKLSSEMFPFHAKVDPLKRTINFPDSEFIAGEPVEMSDHEDNILRDNDDVVGSSGATRKLYNSLLPLGEKYSAVENGDLESAENGGISEETALFTEAGTRHRTVTGRNAPTTYGAVYHKKLLWDGRAKNTFNGVNEHGDMDVDAKVWRADDIGNASQVSISIENAALASQAVGPPLDAIETSFIGRTFADLGQKMLTLSPLAQQEVHPEDSVLGSGYLNGKSYADLVRVAFKPEWHQAGVVGEGDHTQMEENFSLFWGVSIMLYERTLIPDNTKYDAFARSGFRRGFTDQEKEGLSIFLNEGGCAGCHHGPFFAGATFAEESVEQMKMQFGDVVKTYDSGFYNIGVSPTAKDIGNGGTHGGEPISDTLRSGVAPEYAAVNGAFKTNTLRNIEYTAPYMHNGSMKSLREVIEFYVRGGNFANEADRSPDVNGIKLLRDDPSKIDSLIAFLHTLTDDDAVISAAPFDHPSITIANGASENGDDQIVYMEATGRNGLSGNRQIREFDEILEEGGLTTENHKGPLED